MMELHKLLKTPLNELHFSKKFLKTCDRMRLKTLGELLNGKERLTQNEYFSYLWLEELVSFLDENKLLYLLQPLPGSIQD